MDITRGTTPAITYDFPTIDAQDIRAAYLTIKQDHNVLVQKDISTATAGEGYLEWTLDQADTLALQPNKVAALYCDWVLNNGTRGSGKTMYFTVRDTGKDAVI